MDRTVQHAGSLARPIHAILLAFPVALYPSALLTDIVYLNSAHVQWTNFSSWLIAGADFFTGILLCWALLGLFFGRARYAKRRGLLYVGIVAALFAVGLINALQHAHDGWQSVGTAGLLLSILCTVLAFVAAFIGYGSAHGAEKLA